MISDFSITQEEYKKFQEYYTFNVLKCNTYRYGQAFLNYFDDATEYFRSISNLGKPPDVHVPDLSYILWNETSYDKAKNLIEEMVEII